MFCATFFQKSPEIREENQLSPTVLQRKKKISICIQLSQSREGFALSALVKPRLNVYRIHLNSESASPLASQPPDDGPRPLGMFLSVRGLTVEMAGLDMSSMLSWCSLGVYQLWSSEAHDSLTGP